MNIEDNPDIDQYVMELEDVGYKVVGYVMINPMQQIATVTENKIFFPDEATGKCIKGFPDGSIKRNCTRK